MKKFILSILTFILILIIPLYVLDYIVSAGLKKSTSETYNTINKIVNGTLKADIIINGSSKALVQVSPKILDTILQQNSYNLGMDGNEFIPQLLQYQLYRDYNTKPQMIIQIVGNDFLQQKKRIVQLYEVCPLFEFK